LFCNQWVSNEAALFPPNWWEACKDEQLSRLAPTKDVSLYVGVDAAVKPGGDDAAVIACYEQDGRINVAWHKIWHGGKARSEELRLDQSVEPYLLDRAQDYRLVKVGYDPRFMVNVANRLRDAGLNMVEIPQTRPELGPRGQALYNVVQDQRLVYYPDPELEKAAAGAAAREIPQGLHIVKGVGKVDILVALSFPVFDLSDAGEPEKTVYAEPMVVLREEIFK